MKLKKEYDIKEARSMHNGISFVSQKCEGCIATAIIDENGKITTEWVNKSVHDKYSKPTYYVSVIITFIIIAFSFNSVMIKLIREYLALKTVIALLILIAGLIYFYSKDRRVFRFHSAEHMAINAYNKLKRVPTLEEIKKYSRFCNQCGTNHMFRELIVPISMIITTYNVTDIYRPLALFVLLLGFYIIQKIGFFNVFQLITTRKATDEECMVAIAALELLIEKEKQNYEKNE